MFVGDDVAAMGLHILRMNEPSRRYVGAEVRISGTSNALVVLRVKRGRTSHIESATCLMTKDSDGVSACCALVGKRATLDAVTSKSGKKHLYVRVLSLSKTVFHVISVGVAL